MTCLLLLLQLFDRFDEIGVACGDDMLPSLLWLGAAAVPGCCCPCTCLNWNHESGVMRDGCQGSLVVM